VADDDKLTAALAENRDALAAAWSVLGRTPPRTLAPSLGISAGIASMALDALDTALKFHQRVPLYGNAATDDEPGACPHDPDDACHFEDADEPGEWLCRGKPEGAVCPSCTEDGLPVAFPCPEYSAILTALTGRKG
jgi:hypothetical protein